MRLCAALRTKSLQSKKSKYRSAYCQKKGKCCFDKIKYNALQAHIKTFLKSPNNKTKHEKRYRMEFSTFVNKYTLRKTN
jgi:uncharacterized cysteine cluster protein YcgN (CxxCxxCC family)